MGPFDLTNEPAWLDDAGWASPPRQRFRTYTSAIGQRNRRHVLEEKLPVVQARTNLIKGRRVGHVSYHVAYMRMRPERHPSM
jgi:hypothetical protein